jgi:hypothetical protein
MRRFLVALLLTASPLSAQTAADSTHVRVTRPTIASLDSVTRTINAAMLRVCGLRNPTTYQRAACALVPLVPKKLAELRGEESTLVAFTAPTPVPTPTPTPVPPVDTTTPTPPPTGTVGPATVAELPRNVVPHVRPTVTRAVKVCATCSLQAAMNAAVSGDELLLVPGAVYPGNFVWPNKGAAYGHPIDDYTRTGRMWGAILGVPDIDPRICCLMMSAVKISREVNAPKRDNRVDLAGYAECAEMVAQRQAERP